MMYIHGNNETDRTINVSKIANTSTLDDNSTAAGCNSRLMIKSAAGKKQVRRNFAETLTSDFLKAT